MAKELVASKNTNTVEMPRRAICNNFIFDQYGKNVNKYEVCDKV